MYAKLLSVLFALIAEVTMYFENNKNTLHYFEESKDFIVNDNDKLINYLNIINNDLDEIMQNLKKILQS